MVGECKVFNQKIIYQVLQYLAEMQKMQIKRNKGKFGNGIE